MQRRVVEVLPPLRPNVVIPTSRRVGQELGVSHVSAAKHVRSVLNDAGVRIEHDATWWNRLVVTGMDDSVYLDAGWYTFGELMEAVTKVLLEQNSDG